jgi:hypothetical protein
MSTEMEGLVLLPDAMRRKLSAAPFEWKRVYQENIIPS